MDENNFQLNNPNNPNNSIDKAKEIETWNNNPEVKRKKIKAIDEEKEKAIGKTLLAFLYVMSGICLIAIAGAAGIWGFTVYHDKTLIPSFICGNVSVLCEGTTCPNPPSIPQCPACACDLNCGSNPVNVSIKIYQNMS